MTKPLEDLIRGAYVVLKSQNRQRRLIRFPFPHDPPPLVMRFLLMSTR